MIQLGDITKIDWATVPPVDCVTGGSPCQDLSVAGKRAGLAGDRSGLYMEQIRCVKELREADEQRGRTAQFIRPRYMVWENVPGAFSSNGGEDFRAVLEEAAKIADETAIIPRPSGKWSNSGAVMGDGWSLAWRVHDAQFWGVPSVVVESRLSAILEDSPHPKYSLSEKACQGILKRAERRGKKLPGELEKALILQSQSKATP